MIGALIGFIIVLILAGFAYWALQQLLAIVSPYIAEPFATLVRIVLIFILILIVIWAIVYLLGMIGVSVPVFNGMHVGR